ncbi:MAG: hypothetical protein ACR2LV_09850 [Solirubrobacteraceae bacterium]
MAQELSRQGHVVRGTTRDPSRGELIRAAGAEPLVADPDRIATLVGAFEHVSVACVLLGSAVGSPTHLASLHGTRLEMLLARLLDTTVRGIVYERSGSVDPVLLRGGAKLVQLACERSRIPYALLEADPLVPASWLEAAVKAVGQVLQVPSSPR